MGRGNDDELDDGGLAFFDARCGEGDTDLR
jgi:hypothetical protein